MRASHAPRKKASAPERPSRAAPKERPASPPRAVRAATPPEERPAPELSEFEKFTQEAEREADEPVRASAAHYRRPVDLLAAAGRLGGAAVKRPSDLALLRRTVQQLWHDAAQTIEAEEASHTELRAMRAKVRALQEAFHALSDVVVTEVEALRERAARQSQELELTRQEVKGLREIRAEGAALSRWRQLHEGAAPATHELKLANASLERKVTALHEEVGALSLRAREAEDGALRMQRELSAEWARERSRLREALRQATGPAAAAAALAAAAGPSAGAAPAEAPAVAACATGRGVAETPAREAPPTARWREGDADGRVGTTFRVADPAESADTWRVERSYEPRPQADSARGYPSLSSASVRDEVVRRVAEARRQLAEPATTPPSDLGAARRFVWA